ncbi:1-phosphofructokinase [Eubacteriales bacterium OttesenSCG-928-A19]|nr:1-phosphofructokinase [Eubacteriales bacterium OttesenSCG-928-A19]
MVLTVTLNPALDYTMKVSGFAVNAVNRVQRARMDPGGKGINVSKWVKALGGETVAIGIIRGRTGNMIRDALASEGIVTDFVTAPGETRTNIKIADPDGKTNTDINAQGDPVERDMLEAVSQRLTDRVRPGDIVVLAGRNPPGTPDDLLPTWIRLFQGKGAKVFLDVDDDALRAGLSAGPFLAKPNDAELSRLVGRALASPEDVAQAARTLLSGETARLVVSLGSRGALFLWENRTLYAGGLSVPVGSTVGAGDAMVAALAYSESKGLSLEEALPLAMASGAASVMQSGTQVADPAQVRKLAELVQYEEW